MGDKPPKLLVGSEYLAWKREVAMWTHGTSLIKKKHGPVAALRIEDRKARDFANRLDITKVSAEEGLAYLFAELDKYYAKDKVQTLFLAIDRLESFIRPEDMSMVDYCTEFGRRVDAISELISTSTEKKLPYDEGVQAYRLLKQARLTKDQQILAIATVKSNFTYEDMEGSLKRAFGDAVVIGYSSAGCSGTSSSSRSNCVKIKAEPTETFYESHGDVEDYVYYTRDRNSRVSSRRGRDRHRGGNSYNRGFYNKKRRASDSQQYSGQESYSSNRENMKDPQTGEILTCNICNSTYHFARYCPHASEE